MKTDSVKFILFFFLTCHPIIILKHDIGDVYQWFIFFIEICLRGAVSFVLYSCKRWDQLDVETWSHPLWWSQENENVFKMAMANTGNY